MPGDLELKLDFSELDRLSEDIQQQLIPRAEAAVAGLAQQAHAHIVERAKRDLHSRQKKFLENLEFKQVSRSLWVITVKEPALWIEEGKPAGNMLIDLLSSPKAKIGKRSVYLVIPFEHAKPPTRSTPLENTLTAAIKAELKRQRKPYKAPIFNKDGRTVKQGLVDKMDIYVPQGGKAPIGHYGPDGQPTMAHPVPPGQMGPEGRPFLWGLRIYQKRIEDEKGNPLLDKKGRERAHKAFLTFRTASSRQFGLGKWDHPGLDAMNFLDEAEEWIARQWDYEIKPSLLAGLKQS